MAHTLTGETLSITQVASIAMGARITLSSQALTRCTRSHRALLRAADTRIIYGVNTGFGPMAHTLIGTTELEVLQRNLILSHACGAGEPVDDRLVIAAMTVRLNTLLRGDSGVSPALIKMLAKLINARVAPTVPEHGGVGASGDLIQLAHIAAALIGEGEVSFRGRRMRAAAMLKKLGLRPYILKPKEGLALINGTSFMTAVAALAAHEARAVLSTVVCGSALALEVAHAFDDSLSPYLHAARPHPGQISVARALRRLTAGSRLLRSRRDFERSRALPKHTEEMEHAAQDVYSLRCTSQILGPMLETLCAVEATVGIELNAATDNPLVSGRGEVLHGGNFHGEYIAAAADDLKRALAKVSMLCERRLNYFLHDKLSGLPPFLNAGVLGLTLGLQGLQFTATSTTALNQTLSYPASLHSIPSNADNQDIVSMGADAALLCARVVRGTVLVAAIELLALSQACYLIGEERRLSSAGRALVRRLRKIVAPITKDRLLHADVRELAAAVSRGEFSGRAGQISL